MAARSTQPYAGFEPRVGQVEALRTFRIGADGSLYPLYVDSAWSDGENVARCRAVRPLDDVATSSHPHDVPHPNCTCGFYAYANEGEAADNPHARHVLAVVATWGRMVAGTRGVRAERAAIEAVWFSAAVPRDLAARVAARYPGVAVYEDRTAMLVEHPATRLDCYAHPAATTTAARTGFGLAGLSAVVIGALPSGWILHHGDARLAWLAALAFFAGVALFRRSNRGDRRDRGRTLLSLALVLWLLAPFAGTVAFLLLRLPLLEIACLAGLVRRRENRAARCFPAPLGLRAY